MANEPKEEEIVIPRKRIIAFVGPSGAGKSTIIDGLLPILEKRISPDLYGAPPTFTSRPLREDEEPRAQVTRISLEEGRRRYDLSQAGINNEYLAVDEFAGNYYGIEREALEGYLATKVALQALTPMGALELRHAGYTVDVLIVVPIGHTPRPDREEADKKAAKLYPLLEARGEITADHTIENGIALTLADAFKKLSA